RESGISPRSGHRARDGEETRRIQHVLQTSAEARSLEPDRPSLPRGLWQLHRYPEAREQLKIILRNKSDDPESRLLLGMVAENMKDYATAARTLASVPDEVRKQPESIAALGNSYYRLGDRDKARSTLQQLENHPAGTRAAVLGAQIADENADYSTAEQM